MSFLACFGFTAYSSFTDKPTGCFVDRQTVPPIDIELLQ